MNEHNSVDDKLYARLSERWQHSDNLEYSIPRQTDFKLEELDNFDSKTLIEGDVLFPCDKCEFESYVKKELVSHKITDHKQLGCDDCNYQTNFKGYLRNHKRRHHGPEKVNSCELLKCPSCEFETKSAQYLSMHIDSKHNKELRYRCSLCEYKNFRKQNVEHHQKTKHPKTQCKVIGGNFEDCQ